MFIRFLLYIRSKTLHSLKVPPLKLVKLSEDFRRINPPKSITELHNFHSRNCLKENDGVAKMLGNKFRISIKI